MAYKSPIIKSKYLKDLESPASKLIRYLEDQKLASMEDVQEEEEEKDSPEETGEQEDSQATGQALEEAEKIREEAAALLEEAAQKADQELANARQQAEKILAEASASAAKEKESATAQREKTLAQAHKEGFEKGFSEGLDKGFEETRSMIVSASTILGELKARKAEILSGSVTQVVQLSLAVARRVIRCETRLNPQIVVRAIRDALEHICSSENIRILVAREDLPPAEEARAQFLEILKGSPDIGIAPDSTVARGGCIVETSMGNLDAQVETALEVIEREFEKMLHSSDNDLE